MKLTSTLGGNDHALLEFTISRGLRDNKNLNLHTKFQKNSFSKRRWQEAIVSLYSFRSDLFWKVFLVLGTTVQNGH